LREQGLKVICHPEATKLQKQFRFADRMGIRIVTVIGPDENVAGNVTIRIFKNIPRLLCHRRWLVW